MSGSPNLTPSTWEAVQKDQNPPELTALSKAIERTLERAFGEGTTSYNRYAEAAAVEANFSAYYDGYPAASDYRERIEGNIAQSKHLLADAIKALDEEIADRESQPVLQPLVSQKVASTPAKKIFIVHGHDDGTKEMVARFLEKIDLEVIILHERANKGRTIITKFREEAEDVGFAVVLMTPDDIGGKDTATVRPRARPNVVFELGFFIGALGTERVAAMVKGELERPSDVDGIVYIPLHAADWKSQLAKELSAAGFAVDWNKVMR